MKKILIPFFAILVICSAFGQDSLTLTIKGKEKTYSKADLQATIESMVADTVQNDTLADELCLPVQDTIICLPTGDGKEAYSIIQDFFERNKGNWPKNAGGWIALILAFLVSVPGVTLITRSKSIYNFLVVFLRNTLNIVLFVAGAASALLTYVWGLLAGTGWHWNIFLNIWPFMAFFAVWVYERFFKKKADIANQMAAKTAEK